MTVVRIIDIKSEKFVYVYAFGEEGNLGISKHDFGFYDLEINGIHRKAKCYKIPTGYDNKFSLLDDYFTTSGYFFYHSSGKLEPVVKFEHPVPSSKEENDEYIEPKKRKRTRSSPRRNKY